MPSAGLVVWLAACAQLPDVPEVDKATVYVSIATPGGFSRVMLSCPQLPPLPLLPKRLKP